MSLKNVLTGDRPTGPLHLGHYIGSLQNRVRIQNNDSYKQFVMIADTQALTDNFETPKKITDSVFEVVSDYLAIGLDPDKTTIFVQSQIPELSELAMYYMNLVTVGRLERNPTVKTEIQQKGYSDSIPAGFLCYPISQAADITAFKAEEVPVGEDQLPIIEQCNYIVRKFNRIYNTDILKEANAMLSDTPRLIGIDGKAKASKSLGNAVFLGDSAEEVKKKVFSMYTDPDHLKITDSGKIEGNVVFEYLDAFHPNKAEVEDLKAFYKRGGLGDVTIKNLLNETLQNLLAPIREKRQNLKFDYILDVLRTGTQKARTCAQTTLEEVRKAIGIEYW